MPQVQELLAEWKSAERAKEVAARPAIQWVGVHYHRVNQCYAVRVKVEGRSKHCGYFTTSTAAIRYRDRLARNLLGSKAQLNFPRAQP